MSYGDFKDLERITASDKVAREIAFNIVKTQNIWISKRSCFYGLLCF